MKAGAGKTACLVVSLFTFGSLNTILMKTQFTLYSPGIDGNEEQFEKPALGTMNMFIAMFMVLFIHLAQEAWTRRRRTVARPDVEDVSPSSERSSKTPMPVWKQYLLISVPALFDLVATGLCMIGILFIPASVWQMLRGAEIIFAAILTVMMRRKLHGFHWVGVGFCFAGIACVGIAATQSAAAEGADAGPSQQDLSMTILGMSLTLLGQVVQAAQIIAEESLLEDMDMPCMLIVGVEGFWGSLIMALLVYPVLWVIPGPDHGHVEDPIDTIAMIRNSGSIQLMMVAYIFSCATYNVAGMMVTEALSGVMRVMLEATRTICIWVFGLVWHYGVDPTAPFGERWTSWSYVQAFGFVLLLTGQATYGEKLKWTGEWTGYPFFYPQPSPQQTFTSPTALRTGAFSSPGRTAFKDELQDSLLGANGKAAVFDIAVTER